MNLIPWRNKRTNSNGGSAGETSLARLRSEMDNLFDRFFQDPWAMDFAGPLQSGWDWGPRTDLAESDTEVTVTAELPGVDPRDVEIDVSGNLLTIHGEKKQEHHEKKRNYRYSERRFGSFHRSIQLPSYVDPDKVDASYKNGTLTVTLAKRPDARPKKITVRQA